MKAQFRVQHEVLSGLKYLQVVKRKGIRVDKDEQMLGSYAPNTESKPIYEQACMSPALASFVIVPLIITCSCPSGSAVRNDGAGSIRCRVEIHRR